MEDSLEDEDNNDVAREEDGVGVGSYFSTPIPVLIKIKVGLGRVLFIPAGLRVFSAELIFVFNLTILHFVHKCNASNVTTDHGKVAVAVALSQH
ncbi:hypothetical protein RJT34_12029 [Clitoria ternatea]|uniref:Uncharacterized protein n=1 Tax=Clitoria ternatea TaxID=43366 RepID=A0AAN9JNP4_CLITE